MPGRARAPETALHDGRSACVWRGDRGRMLRRKPTRLELKLDDVEEFESIKKDLEARKKQQREEVDLSATEPEAAVSLSTDPKSREQSVQERIGYKPQPKPNSHATQFGNFEF